MLWLFSLALKFGTRPGCACSTALQAPRQPGVLSAPSCRAKRLEPEFSGFQSLNGFAPAKNPCVGAQHLHTASTR